MFLFGLVGGKILGNLILSIEAHQAVQMENLATLIVHHLFSIKENIMAKVTGQNLNITKLYKDRVAPW